MKTEQIESYVRAMDQVPAVIWTTDLELCFTLSTGRALNDLGLKKDEVLCMSLYEYFDTNDPTYEPIAAHIKALDGEKSTFVVEWNDRIFQNTIEPLYDEDEKILGCIGIALDITEIKEDEAEKRVLEEDLREKQKMQVAAQLASIISNDFNNLMTVIEGNINLLDELNSNSENTDMIKEISSACVRARDITAKLMNLSQKNEYSPTLCDLNKIVVKHIDMVRHLIGSEDK
ncbi:MAG: hypothetical protein HRT89_20235, partial [Lentisphaeria bacterium]|nr:hypothetical protein [Lentisphaeria bacterium]NQZ70389.1 hypothetical protein [Lentisphaeria bacterium]